MLEGHPDAAAVQAVLKDFQDPESGRDIVTMQQVHDVKIEDGTLHLTLGLTSWARPIQADVVSQLQEQLRSRVPSLKEVQVTVTEHTRAPQKLGQIGLTAKSVIAVGSGKGGVGKSTIAASIAFGLKREGCRVGLMDADVYGPSVPHLLGMSDAGRPSIDDNKIVPPQKDGMPVMSMGFMVPAEEAVVWRGPMLHGAITQFLRDTRWGDLDYLIIDMPPGTGDIALTLSQSLPLSGAVIVCTPQDVALLDAVKAIGMFRKVNIPILGMIENMSGFVCPDCSSRHDIFGSGGARARAEQMQVPVLGEVPINLGIRTQGDSGNIDAAFEDPIIAPCLSKLAYHLVRNLSASAAAQPPQPSLPVL